MDTGTRFTYSIYVEASPERVWQGLTDPADTRRYWRHPSAGGKAFPSDWQKGSTYDLVHDDVGLVVHDPEQVILESDPYRRLAYTWHTFTPEWAERVGLVEEVAGPGAPNRVRRWPLTSRTRGAASSSSPWCTTASYRAARYCRPFPRVGRPSCPA
jgi:uncharacterized protein YndB with AHSA1/START domain